MGLSIKNEEVEQLARQLAAAKNVSITEAIRLSLESELRRDRQASAATRETRTMRMREIARRISSMPDISTLTDDEILGYDEHGAPTR